MADMTQRVNLAAVSDTVSAEFGQRSAIIASVSTQCDASRGGGFLVPYFIAVADLFLYCPSLF